MTNKNKHTGICLCGDVKVTITVENNSVGACHCGSCRRWGGGPALAVECGSDVEFEGGENITVYGSSEWAERGFCSRCGSHLFYRLKQGGFHAVPVGLFDDSDQWVLDHQVFIDEKPAFYSFANETKNMTGEEVFAQFENP